MDLSIFYGERPHPYGGLVRGPHVEKNSNLLNGLKCCVIFIVYTQFKNVAAGRWPLVGDPCFNVILRHVLAVVYICVYM